MIFDELDIPDDHKKCIDCDEIKHHDEYYRSKNNVLFKCCKVCYANKFSDKVKESGGSARMKNQIDAYTDSFQKAQVFQFMELCGWTYAEGKDGEPGIWWKKGIKNSECKWDKIVEKNKKGRPKPSRVALNTKFDELYKQINEIAFKRSKGMSFDELAHIYDCSHTTIRTVYKRYEDERRRN